MATTDYCYNGHGIADTVSIMKSHYSKISIFSPAVSVQGQVARVMGSIPSLDSSSVLCVLLVSFFLSCTATCDAAAYLPAPRRWKGASCARSGPCALATLRWGHRAPPQYPHRTYESPTCLESPPTFLPTFRI